jgi:hypothetical protein
MNPLLKKLYKQKKTRVRDPDAPPPPTLLGQVKELRLTRETMDSQAAELQILRQRLEHLEMKNRRLENSIESIREFVISRRNQ